MRSVPTLVLRDMARCTIAWMKLSCLKRQFEVVKCLFLGWNHLWCFRVLSLFVFSCLFASKFVVSTIEIDCHQSQGGVCG